MLRTERPCSSSVGTADSRRMRRSTRFVRLPSAGGARKSLAWEKGSQSAAPHPEPFRLVSEIDASARSLMLAGRGVTEPGRLSPYVDGRVLFFVGWVTVYPEYFFLDGSRRTPLCNTTDGTGDASVGTTVRQGREPSDGTVRRLWNESRAADSVPHLGRARKAHRPNSEEESR